MRTHVRLVARLSGVLVCLLALGFANIATISAAPLATLQDIGDNDNDGILNFLDLDDDNDGVMDDADPEPFNPAVPGTVVTEPTAVPVPTEPAGGSQPTAPTGPDQEPGSNPAPLVSGLPETGANPPATLSWTGIVGLLALASTVIAVPRRLAFRLTR